MVVTLKPNCLSKDMIKLTKPIQIVLNSCGRWVCKACIEMRRSSHRHQYIHGLRDGSPDSQSRINQSNSPSVNLLDGNPESQSRHSRLNRSNNPSVRSHNPTEDESYNGAEVCGTCAMFPSCMSLLSRRSEHRGPLPGQTAVILNVYDMYWTNWYTAGAGVGVFHSGVQVHGAEWAYGGHPYAFTGVFEIAPRDARDLGDQFRFRQSVHIGYTDFSEEEVRRMVVELGKQFRGDRYHLMNNNCNHFTSAFCKALCQRDIPSWVNRLAYVSSCVPFLQRCLPKEWLTPSALQQTLATHSDSRSELSESSREVSQ